MFDPPSPREPPPSRSTPLVCLRLIERGLSILLVLVFLWQALCGGP